MKSRQTKSKTRTTTLSLSRELDILRHIISLLNYDLDLNIILHNVVNMMVSFTKADSCFLYLLDKAHTELVLVASSNPHPKMIRKIKLKIGEGVTGWVAEQKQPVVIPQKAFDDPRFKIFNSLPEDKFECFVGIPILSNDQLIGVINFQHRKKKRYSKSTIESLLAISQLVSGVIRYAWLYDEMKTRNKQFQTIFQISKSILLSQSLDEVLSLIVKVISDVISSPICSIMLANEKKGILEIKAAHYLDENYRKKPPIKIGEGIAGKVFLSQQTMVINDVLSNQDFKMKDIAKQQGLKGLVCVPMVVQHKSIGVINVYTKSEAGFSKEELSWIEVIANQAAIAIENANLRQDTKTAKEALEARKLIERAKGILMKELNISEEAAYRLIHKKSMDTCRPMKEIAQAILVSRELAENKSHYARG